MVRTFLKKIHYCHLISAFYTEVVFLSLLPASTFGYAEEFPNFKIISPIRGERVEDLRPVITLNKVEGADNYVIEISPEPTFISDNTISYVADKFGLHQLPLSGALQRLRYSGINQKYQRYADRLEPWRWKVPYNLTAMTGAPYGYRIIPCRDWLAFFTGKVTEGRDDPLQAINEFVSFSIINGGSGAGYYNAYEMLSRDMGVCGNTAELVATMSASRGYLSKILSLHAPDQGHVVAASKRKNGKWVLLDGLYNIMAEGDILQLIKKAKKDPDFLDIDAFDGVTVKYRHFLKASNYAYQTESTYGGILFTKERNLKKGIRFRDIKYSCSPGMATQLDRQKKQVLSNLFFVRATYRLDGKWAPWTQSYFISLPKITEGQEFVDNSGNIWFHGALVPPAFLGGKPVPFKNAKFFSSGLRAGYKVKYAFQATITPWRSTHRDIEAPYIGVEFPTGTAQNASAIRVGWWRRSTTPNIITVQGSQDGKNWDDVKVFKSKMSKTTPNFSMDFIQFDKAYNFKFWQIVGTGVPKGGELAISRIQLFSDS